MKKILTVLLLCVTISNYAQKTDLYVCELANKLDWFALNNEYPKLKDSVRYDHIRLFAEGILFQQTARIHRKTDRFSKQSPTGNRSNASVESYSINSTRL